jgi:hypothetical protein
VDLWVASAGFVQLPQILTEDGDWSRYRYEARRIPTGEHHAFERGVPVTVCGLPLTALTVWPELSWPGGAVGALDTRCPVCLRIAVNLRQ